MYKINFVFGQIIEELQYIVAVSPSLLSSCCRNIKEYILIMNRVDLMKQNLIIPFITNLQDQDF